MAFGEVQVNGEENYTFLGIVQQYFPWFSHMLQFGRVYNNGDDLTLYGAVIMETDFNAKAKARALFDVAVDEYFAEKSPDVSALERIHKWIHKSFEIDPSLTDQAHVINFMGNLCSLLGWFCEDEGLEDRASSYYKEAIGFLERLDDPCWHEYWYLGKALEIVGELEKALRIFTMALDLAVPGNTPRHEPSNNELAALWADLADLYITMNQQQDAKECLEWALLYAPDDEAIGNALILQCLYTADFDRVLKVCQAVLASKCENPSLFKEYMGIAATQAGDLELAKRTYSELLNTSKNGEAREWYARMIGYLEGLVDGGKGQRSWDKEGWDWVLHSVGTDEAKATPLDEMAEKLREEVRDSTGRLSLQMLQLREEMGRLPALENERLRIRRQLEDLVFGDLWKTLDKATQAALVDAEWHSAHAEASKKNDCSSPAVMYQKAVEIEITGRIIAPFQSFLFSKGVQKWNVGPEQYFVGRLQTLDLPKVHSLLTGWSLLLHKRQTPITEDELRFFPTEPDSSIIRAFLSQYDHKQLDFLLSELLDFLGWAPRVGIMAKHRDVVKYETLSKLRSQLMGSHVQPGILIRIAQLFPRSQEKKRS